MQNDNTENNNTTARVKNKWTNLGDTVPMNDHTFSVQMVCERNINSITGSSLDGWTWERSIDRHNDTLNAIRRPVLVLHFPFQLYHFCNWGLN